MAKPRTKVAQPRFALGDYVVVRRTTVMEYCGDERLAIGNPPEDPPICGWIVGAVRRQVGRYQGPSGSYDDALPAYLEVTGTVVLWQVKTSLLGRALEAREEDLAPAFRPMKNPTPWLKGYEVSQECRVDMRRCFQANPPARMANGRFLPKRATP